MIVKGINYNNITLQLLGLTGFVFTFILWLLNNKCFLTVE